MKTPKTAMKAQTAKQAQLALRKLADPQRAEFLKRFFKTGAGEYAEGDAMLGISVPLTRSIAAQFANLPLDKAFVLLKSKWHEERLLALFILIGLYDVAEKNKHRQTQNKIFSTFIKHIPGYVNNWDLVDSAAPGIVGRHLLDKPRKILYALAKSKNLWDKRVAIVSTYWFIKNNQFDDTLKISEILLNDSHDLVHKAVGWMLREVGKRSHAHELNFLNKFAAKMPRTALRYAIERFPESVRKKYLAVKRK